MTEFFGERQPAAVLKHAILERYLPMFMWKTGSTAPGKRVAYVDGFAGPGLYNDGSPGSPAVAVDTARAIVGKDGSERVDGYLVEENPESCAALRAFIDEEGLAWTVYQGDVEEHLPTILTTLPRTEPAFMFLDPFGLGVPKAMLDEILSRSGRFEWGYRTSGAATEILLNFSLPGLRRNCGHLESTSTHPPYVKARSKILDRLDSTLGGDWWRDIWLGIDPGDRERAILSRYTDGFANEGWSVWTIPCADRWEGPPSYVLLLLTQHPDGVWLFHEAVSNAMEVYRTHCETVTGDLDLFSDVKIRDAMWTSQIKDNVAKLLSDMPSFEVQKQMKAVYGSTLTFAREKHVRAAIKALHKEGVTSTDGKGKIQTMRVTRA
jgi:three-Cys-motif partner protein